LCTTIAGPACARLLADYGADVIKVEALDGDPVRQMASHRDVSFVRSEHFATSVRSVDSTRGRPDRPRAVRKSDVVVENFRPGTLRSSAGLRRLAAENWLVLARISGYGQDGPNRHKPGYGVICEAYATVPRHQDRTACRPRRRRTDRLPGALYAAYGTAPRADRGGSHRLRQAATCRCSAAFSRVWPDVPAYDRSELSRTAWVRSELSPNTLSGG
jgi:crotonobetainyl-CoA:carnitine CoA-transferase CaiB-like acyl-CoA transferase